MRGRRLLVLLGMVLLLAGVLFAGQGSGWFPYPRESFMVGASPWIGRGVTLAAIGAGLLLAAAFVGRG